MAVKIRLKRIGKKFAPAYRVVVLDARKKRDGRVIEEIGLYDPMQEPSLIRIDSERVRYWLGVGAQPSNTVFNLLKITGDYQAFKGLPIPEGKLRVKDEAAQAGGHPVRRRRCGEAQGHRRRGCSGGRGGRAGCRGGLSYAGSGAGASCTGHRGQSR